MAEYLIALKRGARETAAPDLDEVLSGIAGLVVKNPGAKRRLRVDATPEAIAEVRARLSATCHIEPVVYHRHV